MRIELAVYGEQPSLVAIEAGASPWGAGIRAAQPRVMLLDRQEARLEDGRIAALDAADLMILEHEETFGRLRPVAHPCAARNVARRSLDENES
jgi:hypothetical protein